MSECNNVQRAHALCTLAQVYEVVTTKEMQACLLNMASYLIAESRPVKTAELVVIDGGKA
jgi:hypothetical protein